jgi:hypothetical protein
MTKTKLEEHTKGSLSARAREAETRWCNALRLSKDLHSRENAKATKRRRRKECPTEPKAAARHRRYRDKQLGKLGAASTVRRFIRRQDDQNSIVMVVNDER